jgi:hypothetical protein
MLKADTMELLNVLQPGKTCAVKRHRHDVIRAAILEALPSALPRITVADPGKAVRAHLPETRFPGGATAGWWIKAVQLDLEARGTIMREATKPLRLHKTILHKTETRP